MDQLIIKISDRISDNFGDPIDLLLGYISQINKSSKTSVCFDFTNCKFLNPFLIAGIVSISQAEKQKGKQVLFSFNEKNENINSYMKTICFPGGFDYRKFKIDEISKFFEQYHSKSYIPLICFPNGHNNLDETIREKVISAVENIFKNQLKLSGQLLQAIYYLINEITQNIADHSNSETGIVFAQFYPAKNYMDICIADYGKGLFQSYIDSGKYHIKTDEEAINAAIFGKSTKDLPESRGFGISTSRKMLVEGLRGKFFIFSGCSFFVQNYEKQELVSISNEFFYKGCYVALRIPILENRHFNFYAYVE